MAATSKVGSRRENCPILIHHGEAATRNASIRSLLVTVLGMDDDQNSAMSINSRASLVPAAAVIPARRVYTDVVAVKKLVVD